MTDTSKFTPEITQLFRPKPPLQHVEHIDIPPQNRKTADISPLSSFLSQIEQYKAQDFTKPEISEEEQAKIQLVLKKKQEREELREKFNQDLKEWNPHEDPLIKGSPYNTVFIGRLSYDVDEVLLQQKFSSFGKIERVRVVRNKQDNKSKGYAFVVFEREGSARDAAREMNGVEVNGRKIITDFERGRTSRSWKPRRLGGGLGGRVDLVKKKQKERLMLVIQEARGTRPTGRGGRGGRGGIRGGSRGGRGGGRGGRPNEFEHRRREFDDRGPDRRNGHNSGDNGYSSYRNRSERDDGPPPQRDYPVSVEYNSRSRRDNSERDRLVNEREKERERNREKRIQRDRDDIGY